MLRNDRTRQFEDTVMPHLDAAYNLARRLTGDPNDAEDIAQEAGLRAFRFIDTFRGGDPRSWLLRIVRNTAYTFLQRRHGFVLSTSELPVETAMPASTADPEAAALQNLDTAMINKGLEELPPDFREILVLREMEGLAYREIAEIMDVPIGTVMSRLARARKLLRARLSAHIEEHSIEL